MKTRTDFSGQVITYAYDRTGRTTGVDYGGTASDPNGARSDASFTYHPNDLLATASSRPDGVTSVGTSYTFDARNRFRTATRNSRTLTYGYDAASQLTSLQYWNRGTVSYGYDAAGQVSTLNPWSTSTGTLSRYTYRSTGLLNTVQRPSANGITTSYGYDTAARLTGITHAKAGAPMETLQYRLDQNGNRVAQRDNDGLATYQYDSLNRLTHAHLPALASGPTLSSLNYGYDPVGNRTAVTPGRTNVALGKAATQSTTYGGLSATHALDGDTYGHWGTNTGTLASTTESVQPWWAVDLGASQYIDSIDLWNRLDAAQHRLSTFYVFVSDDPFASSDLTATKNQPGVSGYLVNGLTGNRTNLPIARTGRYVRIQLTSSTPTMLTLAEVQVWSTTRPTRTNAALGRGAFTSQSSIFNQTATNPGLDASRAVDGDPNGNWATNTGTIASTGSQVQPWWQVDLGTVQYVDMIDVWNRIDAEQERLSNFYVFVSDAPFASGDLTATKNQDGVSAYFLSSVAPVRTSVPIGRSGRYVRVQLTSPTAEYLRLGEVQVWVAPDPSLTPQAVGKPAIQSSTDVLTATNAVNGDTNGDWASNTMTMTRTGSELRPWWEVDLGAVRELDRLDIWNRRDAEQALLKNALVYVSDVPFTSNTVAETMNQHGVSAYLIAGEAGNRTTIPVKRSGRYVRVQLTGTAPEVLVLAEVQVWSRGAPSGTVARSYDASDRFADTTTFQYDLNGNLLRDGTTTYTYDAANRLMRTVKAGVTSEYFYDALGNLVRMRVGTQTTDFVLDENTAYPRVLAEVRSDGSESMYAYGPDGLHVRRDRSSGAALSTHYPLTDGLGSVRAWTDSAGTVSQRTSYDAWGVARKVTGTASRPGSPGFTGEQEGGDGTVYLRARAYNPTLGRFLQRDTFAGFAARPASLNRYSYAENNPVKYTDPSGHSIDTIIDIMFVVVGVYETWHAFRDGCSDKWWKATGLLMDIVFLVAPGIPNLRGLGRGVGPGGAGGPGLPPLSPAAAGGPGLPPNATPIINSGSSGTGGGPSLPPSTTGQGTPPLLPPNRAKPPRPLPPNKAVPKRTHTKGTGPAPKDGMPPNSAHTQFSKGQPYQTSIYDKDGKLHVR